MPSIANQDFKIYGLLKDRDPYSPLGIPGEYCGELYAAIERAKGAKEEASLIDGFVFTSTNDGLCRLIGRGVWYDVEQDKMVSINPRSEDPAYYDALWAIQQAAFPLGEVLSEPEFDLVDNGNFREKSAGFFFVNEDGYVIKGTVDGNGKLASLYLGEKAEYPENCAVVRLESLLPLVGELPLNTTEIW